MCQSLPKNPGLSNFFFFRRQGDLFSCGSPWLLSYLFIFATIPSSTMTLASNVHQHGAWRGIVYRLRRPVSHGDYEQRKNKTRSYIPALTDKRLLSFLSCQHDFVPAVFIGSRSISSPIYHQEDFEQTRLPFTDRSSVSFRLTILPLIYLVRIVLHRFLLHRQNHANLLQQIPDHPHGSHRGCNCSTSSKTA